MPVIDIGRYPSSFDVFVLLLAMTTPFSLGLIAGGLYGWLIPRLGFLSGLSIGFYIGLAVNFITPCTFAVVAYANRFISFVSIPLPKYLAGCQRRGYGWHVLEAYPQQGLPQVLSSPA